MTFYSEEKITQAFSIFSKLSVKGTADEQDTRQYMVDEELRNLVHLFAEKMTCTVFISGKSLILLPLAVTSPFHVSNESIKKEILPSKAKNIDIYMMYLCMIILFGQFYDSYQTRRPTRDFITTTEWLSVTNERMEQVASMGEEVLAKLDQSTEYNWAALCEDWASKNDVVEGKKADARSISRLSFIKIVKDFLKAQDLVELLNDEEIALTERAMTIIEYYYMNSTYNRGIIEVLYGQEG